MAGLRAEAGLPLDLGAAALIRPPRKARPVLFVTIRRSGGSLWELDSDGVEATRVLFDRSAVAAWQCARWALGLALPCLWRLPMVRPYGASLVLAVPRAGVRPSPEGYLTGRSFGLAFFLEMAARALGVRPIRPVAALAGVSPSGRVEPVDAIREKVRVALAKKLSTAPLVLVEPRNVVEAGLAARGLGATVVAVSDLRTALTRVFGRSLERRVVALGASADDRRALSTALFDATLRGQPTGGWRPIERMATLALRSWPRRAAEGDVRWRLGFAAGVAARHDRNAGSLPAVTRARLRRLVPRAEERLRVTAQYLQQTTDTGQPSLRVLYGLLRGARPRSADAFAEHAVVLGALGRLEGVTGRPAAALAKARTAAMTLLDTGRGAEASRSLCEWLRLSGVLGRGREFSEAEVFAAGLAKKGVRLSAVSRLYVELARGRGLATLGRPEEAIAVLARVRRRADDRRHQELAGSAMRWLARCGEPAARPDDPAFAMLMDLDRAIAAGDPRGKRMALRRMTAREPGLLGHLARAARSAGLDVAGYVQEFYPY